MSHNSLNRREFMGKSGLGILTAGLGLPLLNTSCNKSSRIITRTLGRTGIKLPVVSYGVMNSDNPHMLKKALDLGIRHFDTAHSYIEGKSEQVIGEVVKELGVRDRLTISTKLYFARDREKGTFISEGNARSPLATQEEFDRLLPSAWNDFRPITWTFCIYTVAIVPKWSSTNR